MKAKSLDTLVMRLDELVVLLYYYVCKDSTTLIISAPVFQNHYHETPVWDLWGQNKLAPEILKPCRMAERAVRLSRWCFQRKVCRQNQHTLLFRNTWKCEAGNKQFLWLLGKKKKKNETMPVNSRLNSNDPTCERWAALEKKIPLITKQSYDGSYGSAWGLLHTWWRNLNMSCWMIKKIVNRTVPCTIQ